MNLPVFLKRYFWDVDFEGLNLSKRQDFIILRLLECGDVEAIRWLLKNISADDIKRVISTYRGLSSKSAYFWAFFFDMDKEKIPCLQRSYQRMRRKHWPY